MKVKPFLVPVLFIIALLGTVVVAQSAGIWSTSGRTATDVGQLAPADIKGWMTLQQVIDGTGISQAELYQLANIPSEVPASTALKDLEGAVPDFEVSALRDLLTARLAQPTSTPQALATLQPTPQPTPQPTTEPTPAQPLSEAESTPTARPGDGTGAGPTDTHVTPTPLPPGEVLPGDQVKGRQTLREVSEQCDVPLDALLQALKLPPDTDPGIPIRDLVSQGKIDDVTGVQQVVTELQSK